MIRKMRMKKKEATGKRKELQKREGERRCARKMRKKRGEAGGRKKRRYLLPGRGKKKSVIEEYS